MHVHMYMEQSCVFLRVSSKDAFFKSSPTGENYQGKCASPEMRHKRERSICGY